MPCGSLFKCCSYIRRIGSASVAPSAEPAQPTSSGASSITESGPVRIPFSSAAKSELSSWVNCASFSRSVMLFSKRLISIKLTISFLNLKIHLPVLNMFSTGKNEAYLKFTSRSPSALFSNPKRTFRVSRPNSEISHTRSLKFEFSIFNLRKNVCGCAIA